MLFTKIVESDVGHVNLSVCKLYIELLFKVIYSLPRKRPIVTDNFSSIIIAVFFFQVRYSAGAPFLKE